MFAAKNLLLTPPATTVTPAAIKGTPNYAASSSVTIPTHAAGDLIVIYAYHDSSTTAPTIPSAGGTVPTWTSIGASGANSGACTTAYHAATASNTTSGTWSGASSMFAVVLTGQSTSTPIGGNTIASGGTTSGSATAPAVTLANTDGTSVLLHFFGWNGSATWNAAPSGYTKQVDSASSGVTSSACLDTKNVTTSDGACTQTNNHLGNGGTCCATVEVRSH